MPKSNLFEKRENIDQKLLRQLPELAKIFIADIPENKNFIENPDDPAEHHKKWHQFGIITHTRKFLEFYNQQMPDYLKKWGMEKEINEKSATKPKTSFCALPLCCMIWENLKEILKKRTES
jgi:hypothetical protein